MSDRLKHKFSSFEVQPPSEAWKNIQSRLDAEFVSSDLKLSEQLSDASIPPPEEVWKNLSTGLSSTPPPVRKINYKRVAVAALFCGLIALTSLYILRKAPPANQVVSNTPTVAIKRDSAPGSGNEETAVIPIPKTPLRSQGIVAAVTSSQTYKQQFVRSRRGRDVASVNMLQPVAVNDQVQISGPPLRDDNGQIILDLSLICNSNLPFIAVTAPNGSQTRISDKFLDCIAYLNNHVAAEETEKANSCLERFKNWRDKILKEAAFIPSANNFFDIFELQELIEER